MVPLILVHFRVLQALPNELFGLYGGEDREAALGGEGVFGRVLEVRAQEVFGAGVGDYAAQAIPLDRERDECSRVSQ